MTDAFLSYAELEKALDTMQLGVNASDMHGSLVGYLCAGGQTAPERLLDALAMDSVDAHACDQAQPLLQRLQGQALEQLRDPQFSFNPLLPAAMRPLHERADALVEWCRGFLGGFGLGGADAHKRLSDEGSEILRDFNVIAGSRLAVEDPQDDEFALNDVLEFVRVGAMLLFTEAHTQTAASSNGVH